MAAAASPSGASWRSGKPAVSSNAAASAAIGREKEIALSVLAPERSQQPQLLFLLDPFGHHAQPELLRHRGHGAHDARHVAVAFDAAHEGPVDLERVQGKLPQIGQRRVAGAEVVHAHAHADRAQLQQQRADRDRVLHRDPLGELEHEAARIEAAIGEHLGDVVHQRRAPELQARQVDRHPQL
jgi:hypothetical protein